MTNAASTSNPSVTVNVNEANQNPSHVIGINFVTVKLSDKNQYNLWRIQMECLLKSQHMVDFIKGAENGKGKGKEGDMEAWVVSDSLVKGWILGSLSEEAARKAVNRLIHMRKNPDFTAKDLWDELQRTYDPLFREQAQGTQLTPTQLESAKVTMYKKIMYDAIPHEDTKVVVNMLEKVGLAPSDKLRNNGNTTLHEAVASSSKNHKLLKTLLEMTPIEKTILDLVNSDGSSLLHAAAIGGNIKAVNMLVERSQKLLLAKDKEGRIPLALSISNMQTKTSKCLFKHMQGRGDCRSYFSGESGEEIVVLAISCQDFCLANKIINEYPDAILSDSDRVLTALAQNFPRELNSLERGFCQEFNLRVGPLVTLEKFREMKWSRD